MPITDAISDKKVATKAAETQQQQQNQQAPTKKQNDNVEQEQEQEQEQVMAQQHPIQSGIPPWHSVAFIAALVAIAVPFLPSAEDLDEFSSVETWTHRKFPDLVSLRSLAGIRLGTAFVALGLTFYLACISPGWDVNPNYKAHSKLRPEHVRLQGIGTMCPFTSWCWMILGVGFLTRGVIALAACLVEEDEGLELLGNNINKAVLERYILQNKLLLRITLVLWEMTGPLATLVSCVVKYGIWPQVLRGGKPHLLANFRNQLQHNCNSIFSLLEVTMLGGVPIMFSHLSMATVLGIVYIFFTWFMATAYFGNKKVGPQYLYWFMDTTLEQTTTMALAALASTLTFFYALYSFLIHAVLGGASSESAPSLTTNLLFLIVGSYLVCRFKE